MTETEIRKLEHPRSSIRRALKDTLTGKISEVGKNVSIARFIPYTEDNFPLILIYTDDEESTVFQVAPRIEKRTDRVVIAIVDKADQPEEGLELQNRLDDFLLQVDDALLADPELRETVETFTFLRMTVDATAAGNRVIVTHAQEYEAVYYSATPIRRGLDAFKSIEGDIQIDPTDKESEMPFREDLPQT